MALLDDAPLIAARLLEKCPAARGNVFQTEDLDGVKARSQVTPALHQVLAYYQPIKNDSGETTKWKTTWLVIAVVKNQRQGVGVKAAVEDSGAGQMLQEVIAALDGWRVPGGVGLVRAVRPPNPVIIDGFGYFPLAFETQCVTGGAPFAEI